MRVLFLLLLLANAAFLAWSQYFSPADGGADPLPLTRQIEPEKLKVIGPSEVPPAAAARPAAEGQAGAGQAGAGAPGGAAAAAPPGAVAACMEWGSFTLTDAPRAEKALEPLALGDRLAQRRTEETAGWWVYLPSQGNRPNAMKKAAELKGLGVEEYFVVADEGPFRWAVSLGVFRNEEAAQARLASLRSRGIRSALLGSRETVVPKIWLRVKGVDAALETRLKEAARQIEGSELRPCPAS